MVWPTGTGEAVPPPMSNSSPSSESDPNKLISWILLVAALDFLVRRRKTTKSSKFVYFENSFRDLFVSSYELMKALLSQSFSTLSSIKSTAVDHASALTQFGTLLARLTEEQHRDELDAFVRLQDRFEWNGV